MKKQYICEIIKTKGFGLEVVNSEKVTRKMRVSYQDLFEFGNKNIW